MNFKDSHQPGYLVQANNARYQYYSGLLKYKRTFAEVHNIDAMFGISAEKWVNKKSLPPVRSLRMPEFTI